MLPIANGPHSPTSASSEAQPVQLEAIPGNKLETGLQPMHKRHTRATDSNQDQGSQIVAQRDSGGQCSSHMEVRRLGRHKRDEVVENVVLPGRTSRARDLEVLLIDAQCKWALGNRVYPAMHCAARLCRAWQGRGAFVAPITRQLPYSCWPVTPTGRHITEPCFPFCSTLQSATT